MNQKTCHFVEFLLLYSFKDFFFVALGFEMQVHIIQLFVYVNVKVPTYS